MPRKGNAITISPHGRQKILDTYNGCHMDFKEPLHGNKSYSMGSQIIGQIVGSYTHGMVVKTPQRERMRIPFTHITGIWPKKYPKNPRNRIPFTDIMKAAENGGRFPDIQKIRKQKRKEEKIKEKGKKSKQGNPR